MSQFWFIYTKDNVEGPYNMDQVQDCLDNGKFSLSDLIWWKGQKEWMVISDWLTKLPEIKDSAKTDIHKSIWYVDHLNQQHGPLNLKDLYSYVIKNGIANSCRVWTTGMNKWMGIFEIQELTDYFGISRRKNLRAPIKADLIIRKNDEVLQAQAGSISVGGLGFKDIDGIQNGDNIDLTLKSPLLISPVHTKGRIVYTSDKGFTGLEFKFLTAELESTISDYVKKFQTQSKILKP